MLIESINIPGSGLSPPVQTRLPANSETPQGDIRKEREPDPSRLTELASDMQKNLNKVHDVDLQFTVHKGSGRMMVKVKDRTTGQVIREIPPSALLDLAARLDEIVGLIFDQKA
jgi:flagellar protein FlaG